MKPYENDAVLIALGSNLQGSYDSSQGLLEAALDQFVSNGLKILKRSSWWRSAAWPDPLEPDYLNGLVVVETTLSPLQTLTALHDIEARFGRQRSVPNSPRTLDLDLIAHGRSIMNQDRLVLPHPRAADRLFVMGPLAEVAPDWRHPVLGETATDLAKKAKVGRDASPIG
ncbi:MAG: 2-amino-4-hydroxy-6-hydroxymethyldihydropteridine diphosphokinase [Caulobacteraceae bacterium]|nr:2-amino-4-hydroxy-6-hydroxymethyldihydropteridine diphosphokinase [Caulobacteraceae bacterium]